jgi:SAM-dependent methyltransferase
MIFTGKITRKKLKSFLELHRSENKTLDLGSGSKRYAQLFPHSLTVDLDPKRDPDVIADAHNLPFEKGSFAVVLCVEMLEHVKEPRQVIDEMYRVLAPGGKVILTTRFMFPFHDAPDDYWRFTRTGLEYLFSDWDNIAIQEEAETFETMAILLQRIGFKTRLRFDIVFRQALFIIAKLLPYLDRFVLEKHGEGKDDPHVPYFMSSGYYVVATKPK